MISGFKTKNNDFSFDIITRPKTSSYGCAASYLINRKGMEKIINNFFLDKNYIVFEKKLNLEKLAGSYHKTRKVSKTIWIAEVS